eukprot:12903840-Prorocentrum_lima.AAC.1
MQAHIEAQGCEEVLLRAHFESLQDRLSIEEQQVRDEEKKLCQFLMKSSEGEIKLTKHSWDRE